MRRGRRDAVGQGRIWAPMPPLRRVEGGAMPIVLVAVLPLREKVAFCLAFMKVLKVFFVFVVGQTFTIREATLTSTSVALLKNKGGLPVC